MAEKHLVFECPPWLPNKSSFINFYFLEMLNDIADTLQSLKFLEKMVQLVLLNKSNKSTLKGFKGTLMPIKAGCFQLQRDLG